MGIRRRVRGASSSVFFPSRNRKGKMGKLMRGIVTKGRTVRASSDISYISYHPPPFVPFDLKIEASANLAHRHPPGYSPVDDDGDAAAAAMTASYYDWSAKSATRQDRTSTASAAAILAMDQHTPQAGLKKKRFVLSPAEQKRHTWSSSAAARALQGGGRSVSMRMSAPPPDTPRYLLHGIDPSDAARGAAQAQRNSMLPKKPASSLPKYSTEHGWVLPYTTMDRSMFTSNPPLQPLLDARAKQDKLQESALQMAKLMFDRQRQMADEAEAAQEQADNEPNPYIHLQEAAQRQAQDRLYQMHDERMQNREYRDYYYGHLVPPPKKTKKKKSSRSKSCRSKKRRSSSSRREVPPVPGSGPIFPTRASMIDVEQRERDREALLAAAQRNVKERLRGMEEKAVKDKGKLPSTNMTQWELQAQQALQTQNHEESDRRDMVDLGGGMFMTSEEINAIASRRVQPVLEDIEAKAAAKREQKAQAKEKRGRSRKRKSRGRKANTATGKVLSFFFFCLPSRHSVLPMIDHETGADEEIREIAVEGEGHQQDGEADAPAENADVDGEVTADGDGDDAVEHQDAQVGSPIEQMQAERDGLAGHQVEGVESHDADGYPDPDDQHVGRDHVAVDDSQLHEQEQHLSHGHVDEAEETVEHTREEVQESAYQRQHEQQHAYRPQPEQQRAYQGEEQVHEQAVGEEEGEEEYVDVTQEKTREASSAGQHQEQEEQARTAEPEEQEEAVEGEDARQDYVEHDASWLEPHAGDGLPPRYTPEATPTRWSPHRPGVRSWIWNHLTRRRSVLDRERKRSFFGGARGQNMNQSDTNLGQHQALTGNSESTPLDDGEQQTGYTAGGSEAVGETGPEAMGETEASGETVAEPPVATADEANVAATQARVGGSRNLRDSRFREMMDEDSYDVAVDGDVRFDGSLI
ncbi:hypothetical protein L249_5475 [Ophiocordyceps polyrhachis-furcata BCC 54312]|uniref:Uncharacterized protein n=1 Tax=Ophiocordyceps polyrhachis-furcata BCC 54312 TaxID=1330021 RepID=A0A367LH37_9HYPO|nr:hypothetical protein L249_5475 [Ophiocordyceps polyrhachis-furcata BCC 54312]